MRVPCAIARPALEKSRNVTFCRKAKLSDFTEKAMRVDILAGIIAIALLLIAATVPADAEDPAFDCSKADHEIEELICQDDVLAAKDRKLAEVYQQALAVLDGVADKEEATNYLKAYQRGWVGGGNDCWKADDKAKCTGDAYDMRIAELQARYFLVKGGDPVFSLCDDNSEIVATFIPTDLPTVRGPAQRPLLAAD